MQKNYELLLAGLSFIVGCTNTPEKAILKGKSYTFHSHEGGQGYTVYYAPIEKIHNIDYERGVVLNNKGNIIGYLSTQAADAIKSLEGRLKKD